MAWVKEHEPKIFADAYKVMDVHGYVAWMLTGRPVSSQAAADSLGLFDIQKRDWSDELLDIAGVSREQMADLVEPSYEMGTLRTELALDEAVREMSTLGTSQGANKMTAFGLLGVGDLEVTGLSGRNKFYGVRIKVVSDSWWGRR